MHPEKLRYLGHDKLRKITFPRLVIYLEHRFQFNLEILVTKGLLQPELACTITKWENSDFENGHLTQEYKDHVVCSYSQAIANHACLESNEVFKENLKRYLNFGVNNTLKRKLKRANLDPRKKQFSAGALHDAQPD